MSSPFKTKEFIALNKEWKEKLKKSDFDDIEQDENNLKEWSMRVFGMNYEPVTWQAKEEYYRLADQLLYDHKFKSKTERFIWEQHAKGVSIRNITKALKNRKVDTYKGKVHAVIQELAREVIGKCSKKPA